MFVFVALTPSYEKWQYFTVIKDEYTMWNKVAFSSHVPVNSACRKTLYV